MNAPIFVNSSIENIEFQLAVMWPWKPKAHLARIFQWKYTYFVWNIARLFHIFSFSLIYRKEAPIFANLSIDNIDFQLAATWRSHVTAIQCGLAYNTVRYLHPDDRIVSGEQCIIDQYYFSSRNSLDQVILFSVPLWYGNYPL